MIWKFGREYKPTILPGTVTWQAEDLTEGDRGWRGPL